MAEPYTHTIPAPAAPDQSQNGTSESVEITDEMIAKHEESKRQAFLEAINEVCQKHGYTLQPTAGFNVVKLTNNG